MASANQSTHFRARLLQDALTSALSAQWMARAEVFERARPKRGDYHGRATREQLAEAHARCALIAENCRRHARLLAGDDDDEIPADVWAIVADVADVADFSDAKGDAA